MSAHLLLSLRTVRLERLRAGGWAPLLALLRASLNRTTPSSLPPSWPPPSPSSRTECLPKRRDFKDLRRRLLRLASPLLLPSRLRCFSRCEGQGGGSKGLSACLCVRPRVLYCGGMLTLVASPMCTCMQIIVRVCA